MRGGGVIKENTFKKLYLVKDMLQANFIYKSPLFGWFVPTALDVKDASWGEWEHVLKILL